MTLQTERRSFLKNKFVLIITIDVAAYRLMSHRCRAKIPSIICLRNRKNQEDNNFQDNMRFLEAMRSDFWF